MPFPQIKDAAALAEFLATNRWSAVSDEELISKFRKDFFAGRKRLAEALMKEISRRLTSFLRGVVSRKHPNQGNDIIEDVADRMIRAILTPRSSDGDALCRAFRTVVYLRAMTAIARSNTHRKRSLPIPMDAVGNIIEPPYESAGIGFDREIDFKSGLAAVTDPIKRLALQLRLEGHPIEGKNSIAEKLGLSPSTVKRHINDATAIIRNKFHEKGDK